MAWGYLGEFWDAVVEQVVGGTTYTVGWFQSLGNAVAGAIGGIFEDLTHHFYDAFYFFNWLFDNLGSMIAVAFSPLYWVFNYVDGFLTSATSTLEQLGIEVENITVYTADVKSFLDVIPYFNFIISGVAGCLGIFFLIFIIKTIKQI